MLTSIVRTTSPWLFPKRCPENALGNTVSRRRWLMRVQLESGRPDVPDPLPRVAQGGHLAAIQGQGDFAPVLRGQREVALRRPAPRLAGAEEKFDGALAIDGDQKLALLFAP